MSPLSVSRFCYSCTTHPHANILLSHTVSLCTNTPLPLTPAHTHTSPSHTTSHTLLTCPHTPLLTPHTQPSLHTHIPLTPSHTRASILLPNTHAYSHPHTHPSSSPLPLQLRGEADKRQVPGAKAGLQHNLGLGGAAVVTVYRKTGV